MRKLLLTVIAVAGVACAASARPYATPIQVLTLGTNTSGSVTLPVRGYIDTIHAGVSDGVSTGVVAIAYAPFVGSSAINLATGTNTDEKVWRPVRDSTAVDGTDLASDPPARFMLTGETVTFAVSGSPTGLVWKFVIILDPAR